MIHLKLERACAYYCGELRNTHKKQRHYLSYNKKAKPFWDLPKCAVVCCGLQNKIYKDFSKPVRTKVAIIGEIWKSRAKLLRNRLFENIASVTG